VGFGAAAFARFACHLWLRLAEPKLAKRAKAGEPGRTRTCNQTVMSAAPWREIRTKSAFLDQDHLRLCAFVHGVSAG
jgi:hypothetical protein